MAKYLTANGGFFNGSDSDADIPDTLYVKVNGQVWSLQVSDSGALSSTWREDLSAPIRLHVPAVVEENATLGVPTGQDVTWPMYSTTWSAQNPYMVFLGVEVTDPYFIRDVTDHPPLNEQHYWVSATHQLEGGASPYSGSGEPGQSGSVLFSTLSSSHAPDGLAVHYLMWAQNTVPDSGALVMTTTSVGLTASLTVSGVMLARYRDPLNEPVGQGVDAPIIAVFDLQTRRSLDMYFEPINNPTSNGCSISYAGFYTFNLVMTPDVANHNLLIAYETRPLIQE